MQHPPSKAFTDMLHNSLLQQKQALNLCSTKTCRNTIKKEIKRLEVQIVEDTKYNARYACSLKKCKREFNALKRKRVHTMKKCKTRKCFEKIDLTPEMNALNECTKICYPS